VTPIPATAVLPCSTGPFPEPLTGPPLGLGPPQLEDGFGLGPGPPVLSGLLLAEFGAPVLEPHLWKSARVKSLH